MALRSQRSTARPPVGRDRPLRRRVAASCLVVSLVAGLVAGACGGGSHPEATSASPSSAGGSSSSSGAASASTTTRPQRDYPAGGPTDPIFPPGDPSYELVTADGCNTLLTETQTWVGLSVPDAEGADTVPLYQSAAYACLGRWADAERSFEQITVADPDFRRNICIRTALLDWLTPLIREWQGDHAFSPVFQPSSSPSPCPPEDTETTTTAG